MTKPSTIFCIGLFLFNFADVTGDNFTPHETPPQHKSYKGVRRVEPPFSKYLQKDQKRELTQLIKEARQDNAPNMEVRRRIYDYLRSNLDSVQLNEIAVLIEGGERMNNKH